MKIFIIIIIDEYYYCVEIFSSIIIIIYYYSIIIIYLFNYLTARRIFIVVKSGVIDNGNDKWNNKWNKWNKSSTDETWRQAWNSKREETGWKWNERGGWLTHNVVIMDPLPSNPHSSMPVFHAFSSISHLLTSLPFLCFDFGGWIGHCF